MQCRDVFDLVLGFGGRATIPAQIRDVMSAVIERFGVNKNADLLWDAIIQVVSHDLDLLRVNNVVAVYRERGSETIDCRAIGLHSPPMRPWGIEFAACNTDRCTPKPYEFHTRTNAHGVSMQCRRCGWSSAVVKMSDIQEYVFPFNSTLPDVYWHAYPTSTALAAIFVTVTKHKQSRIHHT